MRTCLLVACLALPLSGQQSPRSELSVAFVGNAKSPRTADFAAFLREHFAEATVFERRGCDPDRLRSADVVLLDWSQHDDGIMTWVQNRGAAKVTPLGDRESWDRPTVLLGSAGLNLATAWDLPGGFG